MIRSSSAELPRTAKPDTDASIPAFPVARATKAKFPRGSVIVLQSPVSPYSGETVGLDEVVTTFGIPNEQLIVLTRRPQGYFATHVEGKHFPSINGQTIGSTPYALHDGDMIEAAGYQLAFKLEPSVEHS